MYRNPAIRKIIDASHLTNFIKEKFALPARPVTSARYIHLRHKPTKTAPDAMGYGTVISFLPGHVDLSLSMAELAIAKTDFDPDLKDHPKLSDVLARLGIDDKLTMGLAPDTAPGNLKRTFRTMGSMGVEYNNIEFKAQPWYADYFATKNQDLKSNDLGNLRAAHLSLLYKICREQLQRDYSLGGRDKPPPESIWTLEEFITYFTTGIAMDLVDVAGILLKAGLMPNTDPEVLDRMRRAGSVYNKDKQRVERHPASFLALGQLSGWSNAAPGTPGTYPPDVDRHPPKDAAAEIKARQDGDTKLAETIRKNEQTFLDQLGAKPAPLPAPVWVVRELSLDHDKALIEAHLAALSDDDRYLRFGVSNLAAASSRLFSAKSGHFGVFDPTGKTMVGLGLGSFLVTADVPSLDVGLSVLPAYRKKGVAKLAVQWVMCRARNRGVRLLEVQYYSENVGSMKLLEVLGTPVHKGRFDNLILVEMAMPEADGASHLMEATHLHFSSAWPKK